MLSALHCERHAPPGLQSMQQALPPQPAALMHANCCTPSPGASIIGGASIAVLPSSPHANIANNQAHANNQRMREV
jgi:hypothetical protein